MNYITIHANPSGAYPPILRTSSTLLPPDTAVWPDGLPTDDFYAYNGFVTLTVETIDGAPTVTACVPNVEAREAWKASLPPAVEPEPVGTPDAQEDIDAMLIDHEFRLTLLELGLTEGGEV